jgi:hypothetical protein
VFLPAPTECTAAAGINTLLADCYGVADLAQEPKWAGPYELPAETPHRHAIEVAVGQITELQAQVAERQQQWDAERRFRGLLYAQGEALELLVLEALRALSAQVSHPERKGEHDGRAVDPARREYVLEIKGRKGHMGKDDARQAADHVTAVHADEGPGAVGLFVANAYCDRPLTERKSDPFESNGRRVLVNTQVRVLKTTQLFEALRQKQLGQFDQDAFWERVFKATPLAELPEPSASTAGDEAFDAGPRGTGV